MIIEYFNEKLSGTFAKAINKLLDQGSYTNGTTTTLLQRAKDAGQFAYTRTELANGTIVEEFTNF